VLPEARPAGHYGLAEAEAEAVADSDGEAAGAGVTEGAVPTAGGELKPNQ